MTKPSPKVVACATRASATTAAESAERNIPARLNASLQLRPRVANRLQCSVVRIWSRRAGGRSTISLPLVMAFGVDPRRSSARMSGIPTSIPSLTAGSDATFVGTAPADRTAAIEDI